MRARLEYDLGRFLAAVDDLEKGIRLSPDAAESVVKAGTVKPGTRTLDGDWCNWTQTELDTFSQQFPRDYRIPLYRGLYLSQLSFYRTANGDGLSAKEIEEFQRS